MSDTVSHVLAVTCKGRSFSGQSEENLYRFSHKHPLHVNTVQNELLSVCK